MREIVFIRHGKSDWDAQYAVDADRPLAARGRNAAVVIGRVLSAVGRTPEFVLSSPAVRAHATAEMAAVAGGWHAPVHVSEALYGGGSGEVLEVIRSLPDTANRAALVGHEPTWSETIGVLIGGGDIRMPTGAAAGLEVLASSWEAVGAATCRLRWLLPPRLFTDGRMAPPD
jgi:phosphohistidine phosphatase